MNGYGKVQYSGVTDADIRGRQMEELIRKKDALDALMAERKHLLANGQKGAEHVLTHHGYNVIDELKPVQSDVPDKNVGRWIPVSERLPQSDPEDLEYPTVIICLPDGSVELGCFYESTKEWGAGENFDRLRNPVAWMPLPEPWKG